MQSIQSLRARRRFWACPPGSGLLIGIGLCLLARIASAQYFLASVPLNPLAAGAGRGDIYAQEDVQGNAPANHDPVPVETISPEGTALRIEQYRREAGKLGPDHWFSAVKFEFGLGLTEAYDDNFRFASSAKEGDEITIITGRIVASLGDYVERQKSFVVLDYSASGNLYAEHGDDDSVDQNGLLDACYRWDRLSLELTSSAAVTHDATSDIATLESNENYDESLVLHYRYSNKTTLVSEAHVTVNDSGSGLDNQQYSLSEAADYQIFNRTSLGFGVVAGRLNSNDGLHETFESPMGRVTYAVTDKVSLSAQVGVDVRQRGSGEGSSATPDFMLKSQWTPYEGTTLLLSGLREVYASESLAGQDFTTTNMTLSIQQRFLRNCFVVGDFEYSHDDYSVVSGPGTNLPARADDYYLFRAGVTYKAFKYFDTGLFYRRQENDSNLGTYSYASNRFYLQFDYLY